jgi:hypothetical protein
MRLPLLIHTPASDGDAPISDVDGSPPLKDVPVCEMNASPPAEGRARERRRWVRPAVRPTRKAQSLTKGSRRRERRRSFDFQLRRHTDRGGRRNERGWKQHRRCAAGRDR